MRKLLGAVLVALLIPGALAAQKVPPVKNAPVAQPAVITLSQAQTTALARVRGDLGPQRLNGGYPFGKGTQPSALKSAGALFNPTGGKNGIYVVGVTAPNATGHVRVLVDAKTGAVISTKVSSFQWGVNAPDWWVKGLDSQPAAKKGEDTLSVKARG